jgi:hypothetical protein
VHGTPIRITDRRVATVGENINWVRLISTVHLAMGPGAHEGVGQKSQDSAEISTTTERRHIGSLSQNPGSQMQQQQQNSVTAKSHVSAAAKSRREGAGGSGGGTDKSKWDKKTKAKFKRKARVAAIRAKADSAEALQKELDETKQALAKTQQQVNAVAPGPNPAGARSAPQEGTPPVNAAMTGTWREAVMPKVNAITAHMLAELENTWIYTAKIDYR